MIVRQDKTYETNSLFLSKDWYNQGNYVVDETTEEGKALADKIIKHTPYFEMIFNPNGDLVDISPTERPPEPTPKPTEIELLKQEVAALWYEVMMK